MIVYSSRSRASLSHTLHITQDRLPESKEFRDSVWHPLAKMGMGAAAATLGQTVTFPVDTVRRRMQMSGGPGTHTRYATFWCAGHEVSTPAEALGVPVPPFSLVLPPLGSGNESSGSSHPIHSHQYQPQSSND